MSQARKALIFAETTDINPFVLDALKHGGLTPMWPWEVDDDAAEVSLVVIDRPSSGAAKISANLRSQSRFAGVPILVLLDPIDNQSITQSGNLLAQLSAQGADVVTKPVKPIALQRYINSRIQAAATLISADEPNQIRSSNAFANDAKESQKMHSLEEKRGEHARAYAKWDPEEDAELSKGTREPLVLV
jgi:DNA-binding response OmpR family regulator